MKKKIYSSIVLSVAIMFSASSLTSCSLDETPKSKFSEEEAFKSSKLIYVNTVANVYSAIGNGLYGSDGSSVHTLQEMSSDASMLPGRQGDWVDGGKWQNIFLHNFDSSVDTYNNIWNNLYRIIGLCNSSIDKLNEFVDENPDCETYIYELRALRALYYYNAMDLYGQIPLVTSSATPTSEVAQSNRSDVFDFVVSELNECLPYLSSGKCQNQGESYGRMTKAVAYMCLAKCAINAPVFTIDNTSETSYQAFVGDDLSGDCKASETKGADVSQMGKNINMTVDGTSRNAWETVKYCVDQIEALGYELQKVYSDNFIIANHTSVENIWIRPNDDKIYKVEDYNRMRSLHYNHAGAIGYSGWNGACATIHEMKVYGYGTADADPRLALNFYTDMDYVDECGGTVEDGATDQPLEYMPLAPAVDFPAGADAHVVKCAGARFKKYEYDRSTSIQTAMNNDLVIWRFADALLLKAEAEYRLGNTGEALTLVNQVRKRVGATPRTSLTLNDLLDERMLELAWEGTRRQDQVRFCTFTQPTEDRYDNVWHNASAGAYNKDTKGYTNVYPIPYAALNLNTNLKQNPGYVH